MGEKEDKSSAFVKLISTIGAVLILVGIAWLIAWNWHNIPDIVKVLILVFFTLISFGLGIFARSKEHEGVGRSLIILGAGLYVLSLFLISQIYDLASSIQHYAWILFLAWTVIMLIAYLLKSPESLLFATTLFFIWAIIQYGASISDSGVSDFGGVIISYVALLLSAGTLLYSSSLFHKAINHQYTNIFRFWSVFYFLASFYVLTFQASLSMLGEYSFDGSFFTIFLFCFIVIAIIAFILAILYSSSKDSINFKEILIFIGIILLIFGIVLFSKSVGGEYNFGGKMPLSLWFLWAIVNVLFIGFIILVLGYGQSIGSNNIINLGMMFFILEIISRYIGFWMNFHGYFAFSILAIFGGVILILGAWLIPKWRKKLIIKKSKNLETPTSTKIKKKNE